MSQAAHPTQHRHAVLLTTILLSAGLLLGGWSVASRAETATASYTADPALETKVDELMAPLLAADAISGSVLIARDGEILLAKGYGLANREYGEPNTPETVFRLGSMTKQFTAAAVLLLAQRGELAVTDSLARFLPDYPHGDEITLHQLLTHTAGVPNYNGVEGYGDKIILPWSIDEVIAFFRDEPLLFAPGSDWAYSNSGYVLLAKVIELVSERSYADFLREEVFLPLGMVATRVDIFSEVVPQRATGHGNQGDGVYRTPYRDLAWTSGAGSLMSTVLDLNRWDRALRSNDLLTASWREMMFTPVRRGYACGWFVREEYGRRLIEHRGAINGFLTQIQRFVDDDVLVVSLYNYETTLQREVDGALAALALGDKPEPVLRSEPVALSDEQLRQLAGRYELMPGYVVTLRDGAGTLQVEVPDEAPAPAVAQDPDTFWVPDHLALIRALRGEDGVVAGILLQQGARQFRARRLADG